MLEQMTSDISVAMMQNAQALTQQAGKATTHKIANMEKIEEASKEFEAVFLAEMLKPMFAGIKSNDMFGGGKGEEIFRGMMIQEYGKMIADKGGVGMTEHVKAELIRIQEGAR